MTTENSNNTFCKFFNTTQGCKDGDQCQFIHSRVCVFYPNCPRGSYCLYPHATSSLQQCSNTGCPRLATPPDALCRPCQIDFFSVVRRFPRLCRWCSMELVDGMCPFCSKSCATETCSTRTYRIWCKVCYTKRVRCERCGGKKVANQCPECEGHACASVGCLNKAVKEYCKSCHLSYLSGEYEERDDVNLENTVETQNACEEDKTLDKTLDKTSEMSEMSECY